MTTLPPTPSDDALMARVTAGDADALAELIGRWQRRIHAFVWRSVRDAEVAEELTQETFWRLWQARRQYQPRGQLAAYLLRIATRLCLERHRAAGSRPAGSSSGLEALPAPARQGPAARALDRELEEALEAALGRLPANQRIALELARMEGMRYAEVAEAMGCSAGAVEQLIFRARQTLRRELAPYLESGEKIIEKKP